MEKKKDSLKPLGIPLIVKIFLGVFIVLVILATVASIILGIFIKKAASSIISGTIEGKTGLTTNLDDLQKGKMTVTDPKTGARLEINNTAVPDNFPTNFPMYPGAKITSTVTGNNQEEKAGFWLTFSTPDTTAKVTDFYKKGLRSNGWTTATMLESTDNSSYSVSQGGLEGTVTIEGAKDTKETTIIIMLGKNPI